MNSYSWWRHSSANIIILLVCECNESSRLLFIYYFLLVFILTFISFSRKLSHYTDHKALLILCVLMVYYEFKNSMKCNVRLHCCIFLTSSDMYLPAFYDNKTPPFSLFNFFVANNDVINYRSRMLLYIKTVMKTKFCVLLVDSLSQLFVMIQLPKMIRFPIWYTMNAALNR